MKFLLPLLFFCSFILTAQGSSHYLEMADNYATGTTDLVPQQAYPTYPHYLRIMRDLARRYPDKCQLETWGTLPSGRKILALKIANGSQHGARPQVLCSAAMHGDETAGYWLLLQLAEHLLEEAPPTLLDELTIYLNPLANPDGAFHSNNYTLAGSRRTNAAGTDLNRNYPDPDDGPHPDRRPYQPETLIFQRIAKDYSFDFAANLHGGAEVFNYPWDTYRERHPDTDWWRRIAAEFADRVHAASPGWRYFVDRQNGTTNGHDWYPIAGSRQDYMNFYHHCREATIEVSNLKRFPSARLPKLWKAIHPALLAWLEEARFGLHGTVTDATTGHPLKARVFIPGHDRKSSEVYADGEVGNYYRYLAAGNYRVTFHAPGYHTVRHTINIKDRKKTVLNVQLTPLTDARK